MEILAVLAEGAVNATFVESEVDGLSDQHLNRCNTWFIGYKGSYSFDYRYGYLNKFLGDFGHLAKACW